MLYFSKNREHSNKKYSGTSAIGNPKGAGTYPESHSICWVFMSQENPCIMTMVMNFSFSLNYKPHFYEKRIQGES